MTGICCNKLDYTRTGETWLEIASLREAIRENKRISFGHCPKGVWGGGVQKFEVVLFPLFDPLSDIKWGEGGGFDHMPTVLRHFLPKYWVNIWILGFYKSDLTLVQNGPTPKLPHRCPNGVVGGGGGGCGYFWTMSKRKALFSCPEQLYRSSCRSVCRSVGDTCEKVTFTREQE